MLVVLARVTRRTFDLTRYSHVTPKEAPHKHCVFSRRRLLVSAERAASHNERERAVEIGIAAVRRPAVKRDCDCEPTIGVA